MSILYSIFKIGQSSTGATGFFSSGCRILKDGWLSSSKNAFTAETPCKIQTVSSLQSSNKWKRRILHSFKEPISFYWDKIIHSYFLQQQKAVTWQNKHTDPYSKSSTCMHPSGRTSRNESNLNFKQPVKSNTKVKLQVLYFSTIMK